MLCAPDSRSKSDNAVGPISTILFTIVERDEISSAGVDVLIEVEVEVEVKIVLCLPEAVVDVDHACSAKSVTANVVGGDEWNTGQEVVSPGIRNKALTSSRREGRAKMFSPRTEIDERGGSRGNNNSTSPSTTRPPCFVVVVDVVVGVWLGLGLRFLVVGVSPLMFVAAVAVVVLLPLVMKNGDDRACSGPRCARSVARDRIRPGRDG